MTHGFEMSVQEVFEHIEKSPDLKLLDVREDFEREICHIKGSLQLTETLAENMLADWDKKQLLIFYCHRGGRSLSACHYFQDQGFTQVRNMEGGVDAWSDEIDSALAKY